jgi:anti-sigma regulatory factor (Ser/Thr protein kinase)
VTGLVHRAMLYERDDAFMRTAVPFVHEGLAADETLLVVGTAAANAGLRAALGHRADAIDFHDSADWYTQPTRTIAAYNSFILDHLGERIRVVAEPGWRRGTTFEIAEWTRYESMVNQAFAPIDASVLCAYDRRDTPAGILDGALRTHPELVGDAGTCPNDGYLDPRSVYAEVDGAPLDPPPSHAATMPVAGSDLSDLRCFVARHARGHGLSPARLNDLLVSATEIATNAVRHGRAPVTCRMWTDEDDLVVEVTDGGRWTPAAMTGFLPPDQGTSGFGLWAVRMLCPLVQLRTGATGTVVRLRVRPD